jgi:hypothetical protein
VYYCSFLRIWQKKCKIPRLDAAIAAGAVSPEFLLELRALALKHAESLRQALKQAMPIYSRLR